MQESTHLSKSVLSLFARSSARAPLVFIGALTLHFCSGTAAFAETAPTQPAQVTGTNQSGGNTSSRLGSNDTTAGGTQPQTASNGSTSSQGNDSNPGQKPEDKPVNAIPKDYNGKPYRSLIHIIPGTIQAEHYDVPPETENGITFNSHDKPATGPYRISGDCLDIHRFGDGNQSIAGRKEPADQVYITAKDAGEWWKYTVQVKETGTYLMTGHFAVEGDGTEISVSFGNEIGTGAVRLPKTDGKLHGTDWDHTWESTDTLSEVTLPAGLYIMTVKVEHGVGLNFDYLTFTKKRDGGRGDRKDSELSDAFNSAIGGNNPAPPPPNSPSL